MAVREIVQFPNPVLKAKAKPVGEITPEIQTLIDDMIETMYAAPGVGLAAPQVGVSLRLAVIDISSREEKHPLLVLINPEVIAVDGELLEEEGCLSVQEFNSNVKRYAKVTVRATDRHGQVYEVTGEDLLARALQHELDHLNGQIILDHVSPLKRELYKRRLKKMKKEEESAS
ncbi:MAG: peptide deformylase [Nitrospirae bacterium]|nr:peptide deformylase [Nitrospirota bacterium]